MPPLQPTKRLCRFNRYPTILRSSMKVKVDNLNVEALEWVVGKLEGYQPVFTDGTLRPVFRQGDPVQHSWPQYCRDRGAGGEISDREKIALRPHDHEVDKWSAERPLANTGPRLSTFSTGETSMVAAMRCYVKSKLGYEVEVPDELMGVTHAA